MWGRIPAVAVLVVLTTGPVGDAHAAAVTVGSPLTAQFTQEPVGDPATLLNSALGEPGATLTTPFAGRVVRWRVAGAGTFPLRVLRPRPDGTYLPQQASDPVTVSAPAVVPASVPIAAGNVVALESVGAGATVGIAAAPGSTLDTWTPPLQTTARPPDTRDPDTEAAFNADVLRPPDAKRLSPTSGPIAGGTPVVITGTDLGETTGVSFGATPAARFSVDSDTQVTAVTPPQPAAQQVAVRVTTPAGSDTFSFLYMPPRASATFRVVARPVATRTGVRLKVACTGPRFITRCLFTGRLGTSRRGHRVPVGAATAIVDTGKTEATETGRTVTVDVRLNATGRRLLARLHRLRVVFTATVKATGRPLARLAPRSLVLRTRR